MAKDDEYKNRDSDQAFEDEGDMDTREDRNRLRSDMDTDSDNM